MIAIVGKALGPALKILVPVFVDVLRRHGPSAIEATIQSWVQGPQRRAWRAYAAAALTGLAASPNTDRAADVPSLVSQAALIADEMVKQESDRHSDAETNPDGDQNSSLT